MIQVVHPGSGCWLSTHPGSRGQKGTRSRIQIRITVKEDGFYAYCLQSMRLIKDLKLFSFCPIFQELCQVLTHWAPLENILFSPDPVFTHPGSLIHKQKQRRVVKNVKPFFCHKFHKMENYLLLKWWRTNLGRFSKNYRTFNPKNCHKALKKMGWRSGIRKKPIPDSGSLGQKSTESRIQIHNTSFYLHFMGHITPKNYLALLSL